MHTILTRYINSYVHSSKSQSQHHHIMVFINASHGFRSLAISGKSGNTSPAESNKAKGVASEKR